MGQITLDILCFRKVTYLILKTILFPLIDPF